MNLGRPPHKGYPGDCPASWTCDHRGIAMRWTEDQLVKQWEVIFLCSRCGLWWFKYPTYDAIEDFGSVEAAMPYIRGMPGVIDR